LVSQELADTWIDLLSFLELLELTRAQSIYQGLANWDPQQDRQGRVLLGEFPKGKAMKSWIRCAVPLGSEAFLGTVEGGRGYWREAEHLFLGGSRGHSILYC
jgi:hypothetical protein